MNKFLRISMMSFAALLSSFAMAQTTVTFVAGTDKGPDNGTAGDNVTLTKDGVTLTASRGVFGRTDNYRVYKGETLTVTSTAGNITQVVFNCTAEGDAQYGPGCFTNPTTGSYTYSGKNGTWTGDAAEFTMTASVAQARFTTVEVTIAGGTAPAVAAPTITGETPFTDQTTVTITGTAGDNIYYTTNGQDPDDREGTLYTAPFPLTETATVKAVAINAAGEVSAVTTKDFVKQNIPAVANIAELLALTDKTTANLTLNNAKVLYTFTSTNNNVQTFVRDATGAVEFYNTGLTLNTNDDLNGTVIVTKDSYNGLPEAVKNDMTNADNLAVTAGSAAEPKAITIAEAGNNICDLVVLSGVQIVERTEGTRTNYYAVSGSDEIQVYDGFHIEGLNLAATETADAVVKGIVVTYKGKAQIQPIENITTGIENIKAENKANENAPMYNLAGQRVDKSYKGVVIRDGKKFLNNK